MNAKCQSFLLTFWKNRKRKHQKQQQNLQFDLPFNVKLPAEKSAGYFFCKKISQVLNVPGGRCISTGSRKEVAKAEYGLKQHCLHLQAPCGLQLWLLLPLGSCTPNMQNKNKNVILFEKKTKPFLTPSKKLLQSAGLFRFLISRTSAGHSSSHKAQCQSPLLLRLVPLLFPRSC